jgi:Protein of unknown function (DUF4100)
MKEPTAEKPVQKPSPTQVHPPEETIDIEMAQPEKQLPKNPPIYHFTNKFQEDCEDEEIAKKILDQKVEITIGDFLGSAHRAAKIVAAGLKLKCKYNTKHQTPLTVNHAVLKLCFSSKEALDYDSDDEAEQEDYYDLMMAKDLNDESYPQMPQRPPLSDPHLIQVNLIGALGPNPLFAMDTGKIAAKATGQNGTEDIILMINTGSELNLISQDVQEKLNIPIDLDRQNWSLQGINSRLEPLVGCCRNVPIEIGGIRFNHHFFIKKGSFEGHDMLLGQPWLVRVGANIKYGGTTEGNHGMDIQVYEKGNLSGSSVSLHALMNEE